MSTKFSLFLIIIISILIPIGAYTYLSTNSKNISVNPEQNGNIEISENKKTYLYKISEESITSVEIKGESEDVKFLKSPNDSWQLIIEENTYPVKPERWSGITILLEGPSIKRQIQKKDDLDLENFGLDPSQYLVKIGLDDNTFVTLNFGNLSPDGAYQYVNFNGEDSVNTLHKSFGEVFFALLKDPPVPEWVYEFEEKYIDQVLVYQSGIITNAFGREIFTETPTWKICDTEIDPDTKTPILISEPCDGSINADEDLISNLINLIKFPKILNIKEVGLKSIDDFGKYGITKDSTYIYLRNNTFTEKGTLLIKPVTISFSDISNNESLAVFQDSEDVLIVDSDWVKDIYQLIKER